MTSTATEEPVITERYERLDLSVVLPSSTNPRTHFDDAYITELARSVADKGVIQPILVRPINQRINESTFNRFEIIAGECRYRASKVAGLAQIPAVIRDYTDEQVLELQLIENIHRQDLTPLEQAVGYRALITANPDKHSAESIAQRIGMSPAWVWDRLKLNDLVPEAKQLLERELISVGHAILIARQKPEHQERLIDPAEDLLFEPMKHGLNFDGDGDPEEPIGKYDDVKAVSIRELEGVIAHHIKFDVEHQAKAVPLQFETTAAVVQEAAALPGRGRKVVSITFDHRASDDVRHDSDERIYGGTSWRLADGSAKAAPTCDHSVLGVVVAGREHYGQTFQVCIHRDKCQVHYGKEIKEREKNQKLRESGQGKKAAKNEVKSAAAREQQEAAAAQKRKDASTYWNGLVERLRPAVIAHVAKVALTPALFLSACQAAGRDATSRLSRWGVKATPKNIGQVAALLCIDLDPAAAAPDAWHWNTADKRRAEFLKTAKAFKFDITKIENVYKAELKAKEKPAAAAPTKKAKGK